jgi:phosphoadenosine phosphosulfate reductase
MQLHLSAIWDSKFGNIDGNGVYGMWCKIVTGKQVAMSANLCGGTTEQDIPVVIYWCATCKTPIIKSADRLDKAICPLCGENTTYLSSDLRPVFPEERLLLEILLEKPLVYINRTVWAENNRFYIDGESTSIPSSVYKKHSVEYILEELEKHKVQNSYDYFNRSIEKFISANAERLSYIFTEATEFIRNTAAEYPDENIVISFSGGKDSTVTADLSVRALSNPSLVHIFGDTTLEFPLTIEYQNALDKIILRRYSKQQRIRNRTFMRFVRILVLLLECFVGAAPCLKRGR